MKRMVEEQRRDLFSTALAITSATENNEITDTKNISTTLKKLHCSIRYICCLQFMVPALYYGSYKTPHNVHNKGKSNIRRFSGFLNSFYTKVLGTDNCLRFRNINAN
jgi:hypothetical protein